MKSSFTKLVLSESVYCVPVAGSTLGYPSKLPLPFEFQVPETLSIYPPLFELYNTPLIAHVSLTGTLRKASNDELIEPFCVLKSDALKPPS